MVQNKSISALIVIVATSLLLAACAPGTAATPTPEAIPTVKAEDAVAAEGRVEPVRYAELALNSSGLVSEVLVKEGEQVKAGQVIARLVNSDAKTLESAQADALAELTAAYGAVRDAQYDFDAFDPPVQVASLTPHEAVTTSETNRT
jgi:multidrug efflux pump subunit AcrA (membrane-fusion protein)